MNSLGGVVLANMDFTIVTSNTLKSKLDLSFAAFIPDIRANLFPSLRKWLIGIFLIIKICKIYLKIIY